MTQTNLIGSSSEFALPPAKPTVDTKVDARAADVHFEELGVHTNLLTGALQGIAKVFRRDTHALLSTKVPPAPGSQHGVATEQVNKPLPRPEMDLGIEELKQR